MPELNAYGFVMIKARLPSANGAPTDVSDLNQCRRYAIQRSKDLLWICIEACYFPWSGLLLLRRSMILLVLKEEEVNEI